MKKFLLMLLLLIECAVISKTFAQCPPNLDGEDPNLFANWKIYTGTCTQNPTAGQPTIATYSPTTPVAPSVVLAAPSRDTITSGGIDPFSNTTGYYVLPKVCPYAGAFQHSIQVGNSQVGSQADRIRYYYHVPASYKYYFAKFYYALVLENALHTIDAQPRFTISVRDSATDAIINCNFFQLIIDPNNPTADSAILSPVQNDVYYKKWTPATIILKNLQNTTVYFEFESTDCAFGGHFGYGYIDFVGCNQSIITQTSCYAGGAAPLFDTLIGPSKKAFTKKYWCNSHFNVIDSTHDSIVIPAVTGLDTLYMIVHPFAGYGCVDTFQAIVKPPVPPVAGIIAPVSYCSSSYLQFGDSSYTTTLGDFVDYWQWNFGDIPSSISATNPDTSNSQNPIHTYNSMGTYTISLIVKTHNGCKSDTDFVNVHVNKAPPPIHFAFSNDSLCLPQDVITISWLGTTAPGFSYQWTIPNGCSIVSGSANSASPITVKANAVGNYTVGFEIIPPAGDTTCWEHKDTTFNVRGLRPSMFVMGNDSICLHEQDTILVTGRPANCGAAIVGCSNPATYSVGFNNAGTTSIPTPFYGLWTQSKFQMLVLASELTSLGFQGGPISEIAWNVISKNSSQSPAAGCNGNGQYAGFTIQMACVPYNSIFHGTGSDSLDLTTPLTTVYTTNSYNTTLGINNFVLQTPYNWDGVSNLLIQTCYNAGSVCYTSNDYVASSTVASIAAANGVSSSVNLAAFAYSDQSIGCDPQYPYSSSNGNSGFLGFYSANRPDVILKGCSGNIPATTVFTWTTTPATAGFPNNLQNLYVSPTVTTTYHVKAADNRCYSYDSFKINVLTVNTVNVTPSATICSGKITNLIATATGSIPPVPVPCGINSFGGCSTSGSTVQVGTGTVTSSTYSPFDNNYNNGRVVMRYPAATLQAQMGAGPKIISAIQFNVTSHGSFFPYVGLTVKMQCYNPTWPSWSGTPNFPAGGSVVYGPSNYSTTAGWNTITLANSYNWDGASDLLIEICFASATFSGQDVVQSTTQASNCAIYAGNGSIPLGCSIPAGNTSNLLPNIKFSYCNFPVNINQYNFHWVANPSTPSPFMSSVDNDTVVVDPFVQTTFTAFLLGTDLCPVFTSDTFKVAPSFVSAFNNDTIVCVGQKVSLFAQSITPGATVVKWKWYSKKHNPINCDTCSTPLITINTGKDTVVVLQSTASGCSRYDTIMIDTFPTPIASFVLDRSAECSKIKVVATATTSTTNGPVTCYWNFNNPDYFGANSTNNIDTAYWINTSTTPLVKTITLKVQQNGCYSSTVGLKDTIHAYPIAHIIASDTEFCSGLIVNESSVGSIVENTLTASYNWWSNPIVTTPANLSGAGPNSFTVNLPNDSTTRVWVYLQITENGCVSNVDSEALTVHGMPSARFRATPNPSCSGDSIHFVYTGKLDPVGSQVHQLTWTFANGSPATYTSNGDYAASLYTNGSNSVANDAVSLTVTQNTCKSAPYSADVYVNPLPNIVIVGPRDICENQISYLTTDAPYAQYTWKDNYGVVTHNDSLGVSKDLTITLNVVDFNNCKGSASVQVTAHPNPVANAGEDQTIFAGNSAHLDGSMSAGGDQFTWIPSHTVNDAHSMLPIATPPQTTSYVLIYTNSQLGCVDYDTVVVHVKDCKPLIIPNAFTPFNNDNIDDYFMILNPDDYYKLLHMEIYNRWGQLLYSTNDKNSKGWDGRYQDVEQPIGTYIYNITAECGGGKLIQLKGDVTLLR